MGNSGGFSKRFINIVALLHNFYERAGPVRLGVKRIGAQAALLALLALIYVLGVWGMVVDHREARRLALRDLLLQTESEARAVEAVLASSWSDFLYLTQSAPLSSLGREAPVDSLARRWTRLDAEAAALLFLSSHPEVERIQIWDARKRAYLVAARRQEAPALLPPSAAASRHSLESSLLRGIWPLGSGESPAPMMEAFLDASRLLAVIAADPAEPRRLTRRPPEGVDAARQEAESLVLAVDVNVEGWAPDSGWRLERDTKNSPLLGAALLLAKRHRSTTLLSLGLMTLALPLGWFTLRQLRRNATLEADRLQRRRIQQLERQLWHRERLTSLGRMAAGIAHEINNPLEGMTNYLGILSRELQQRREEELLKVMSRLREGLERIADVIRQILTFADPAKTPMERLDLSLTLRRTFDFVRANPSFRHISMTLSVPSDPTMVFGNPVTLGQLFLNLILNACQVQDLEGEVAVSCAAEAETVLVTVSDRGPGIAPEHADHLFEPFFSGRGSTGLGLSVCLGIVTLHQGQIECKGRQGGGTVMTVRLPRSETLPSRASREG